MDDIFISIAWFIGVFLVHIFLHLLLLRWGIISTYVTTVYIVFFPVVLKILFAYNTRRDHIPLSAGTLYVLFSCIVILVYRRYIYRWGD